ncbi:VOC family protein [Desemzia sp. FAM 23991]|uniref:VOC family protein n=1 Tax=unclassified Desemzia TaxID=2685243 RepID=UPI0038877302
MFKLNENTKIGKVVLNVENLENMKNFYNLSIGLDIKSESAKEVSFGPHGEDKVLLTLQEVPASGERGRFAGLYHLALLLPSRKDLGEILYHLLTAKYPLTGASDHGYSEALYLDDPEGNGVEIYCDKPVSEWDIRETGEIAGVTEPMDAEGVIAEAKEAFKGMPAGTYMGHVHLFVSDLQKTEDFYQDLLGFDLKYNFGSQAKFFAAGLYHHQIGSNVWAGTNIPAAPEGTRGMDYYTIELDSVEDFAKVKEALDEKAYAYTLDEAANTIALDDPNGIHIVIEVAQKVKKGV